MSTRSYICREEEDGTYTGIYCHSDGYLTHNGAILIDHYQDRDKVNDLISNGDMSCLAPNVNPDPNRVHGFDYEDRQEGVCVFYGRDRHEKGTEAKTVELKDIDAPDSWIEYCYVYGKDNKWKYFETGKLNEGLVDLQEGLDKEYEVLGFPRPDDVYGFFSEDEIRQLREEYQQSQRKEAEMD